VEISQNLSPGKAVRSQPIRGSRLPSASHSLSVPVGPPHCHLSCSPRGSVPLPPLNKTLDKQNMRCSRLSIHRGPRPRREQCMQPAIQTAPRQLRRSRPRDPTARRGRYSLTNMCGGRSSRTRRQSFPRNMYLTTLFLSGSALYRTVSRSTSFMRSGFVDWSADVLCRQLIDMTRNPCLLIDPAVGIPTSPSSNVATICDSVHLNSSNRLPARVQLTAQASEPYSSRKR